MFDFEESLIAWVSELSAELINLIAGFSFRLKLFFDILVALQDFVYECRVIFRNTSLGGILEQTFLIDLRFLYGDSLANPDVEQLSAEFVSKLV